MKYVVLKNFTDKYNNDIKYKVNDIVEFTKKRATEILKVDKLIEEVQEPESTEE